MDTILMIIGIVLLGLFITRKISFTSNEHVKNMNADEAHSFIENNKDVIIIDVRTQQEYKSGHIPGSKSIPVSEFKARIGELEKNKDTPIIVHCASGSRSSSAVKILVNNGFKNINHLNRGLSGWNYKLKK